MEVQSETKTALGRKSHTHETHFRSAVTFILITMTLRSTKARNERHTGKSTQLTGTIRKKHPYNGIEKQDF